MDQELEELLAEPVPAASLANKSTSLSNPFHVEPLLQHQKFWSQQPLNFLIQELFDRFEDMPADGKPRNLSEYFVGLIRDRVGSAQNSGGTNIYTEENLIQITSAPDKISICDNCHGVLLVRPISTPAMRSSKKRKSKKQMEERELIAMLDPPTQTKKSKSKLS